MIKILSSVLLSSTILSSSLLAATSSSVTDFLGHHRTINDLLGHAKVSTPQLVNTTDRPVDIDVVFSISHRMKPGETFTHTFTDQNRFIVSNGIDASGFPVIGDTSTSIKSTNESSADEAASYHIFGSYTVAPGESIDPALPSSPFR
ncbi:MAG: hypothetical protein NTX76_02090 [Alphaproteobacteria bacterium]|nr:hypothetical protein [Alphaproteobacteria bacterium]